MHVTIIHRDDDLVAVDKPIGLPTHAAREDVLPVDVVSIVRAQLGVRYLAVHQRLDRATSGVLVFGLRRSANAWLAGAFEHRGAQKEYAAVVHGRPSAAEGLIDAAIAPGGGDVRTVAPLTASGAVAARTRYRVVATSPDGAVSLLSLQPETGRTHQLRVHLLHIGHPIVGDVLYDPARPAPRLMLHAHRLILPCRGDAALTLEAAVPGFFEDMMQLGGALLDDVSQLDGDVRTRALRALAGAALERRAPLRPWPGLIRLADGAPDGLPGVTVDLVCDELVITCDERWNINELRAAFEEYLAFGADRTRTICATDAAATRTLRPELREHLQRTTVLCRGRHVATFDAGELSVAAAETAADLLVVESARTRLETVRAAIASRPEATSPGLLLGDAGEQLERLARRRRAFDVVIVGGSARGGVSPGDHWTAMAARAAGVAAPGGIIVLVSLDTRVRPRDLRQAALAGLARAGRDHVAVDAYGASELDTPGGAAVMCVGRDVGAGERHAR